MERSTGYIIGFAVAVCLVCSVFVASSAVILKPRQEQNKVVDKQLKVLRLVGLVDDRAHPTPDQVQKIFDQNIKARIVNTKDGSDAADVDPKTFDQKREANDHGTSRAATSNPAQVQRVPNRAMVYELKAAGGGFDLLILPVEGKGLWSTMRGFVSVGNDLQTVKGITFYEHGETPGLGGEIENPRWQGLWPGRRLFDAKGQIAIDVIKGQAGPPALDPHRVDGLSGATITSRGVSHMLRFWLGAEAYGPFLERLRRERSKS